MADTTPPGGAGRDPQPGAGALSTEPLALFGNAADMPLPVDNQPTPADHVPELHAAFMPAHIQDLQTWQAEKPDWFVKRVHQQSGLDR